MQTFLPYPEFNLSAAALDRARLGKQRVETLQIVLALTGQNADGSPKVGRSWATHGAAQMWGTRYLHALYDYQLAVCYEWATVRGYRDTCLEKTFAALERYDAALAAECARGATQDLPWWLGNDRFHLAHQSNLVRKNSDFYGPQFPGVGPALPYWYPRADG